MFRIKVNGLKNRKVTLAGIIFFSIKIPLYPHRDVVRSRWEMLSWRRSNVGLSE
jgi:hypothetical protein